MKFVQQFSVGMLKNCKFNYLINFLMQTPLTLLHLIQQETSRTPTPKQYTLLL